MKLDIYQIDAFTDEVFGGNPACVVPLEEWLEDELLFKIAKENAVPETAFFIVKEEKVHLRWFTPDVEMDLCGHATLASAYVLKEFLTYSQDKIVFESLSGDLIVSVNEGLFTLNFPSRMPVECKLPEVIQESLSIKPYRVLKARDYVLIYEAEEDIRNIKVDRQVFDQINLDPGGVIVTAKGNDCDFVSRFFTPQASILEDPVTGSAHCSLIPYWANVLKKQEMKAMQISERVGNLQCENCGDRVLISGRARTYSVGTFWTE